MPQINRLRYKLSTNCITFATSNDLATVYIEVNITSDSGICGYEIVRGFVTKRLCCHQIFDNSKSVPELMFNIAPRFCKVNGNKNYGYWLKRSHGVLRKCNISPPTSQDSLSHD
jgi:hypothetical protein